MKTIVKTAAKAEAQMQEFLSRYETRIRTAADGALARLTNLQQGSNSADESDADDE